MPIYVILTWVYVYILTAMLFYLVLLFNEPFVLKIECNDFEIMVGQLFFREFWITDRNNFVFFPHLEWHINTYIYILHIFSTDLKCIYAFGYLSKKFRVNMHFR